MLRFRSLVVFYLLLSAVRLAESHEGHEAASSCHSNQDAVVSADYLPGIVTVDGRAEEWASVDGVELDLRPALDWDQDKSYSGGQMTVKSLHDGSHVFFLLQVDGDYAYTYNNSKMCPSVALMFQIGENASYHNMGNCEDMPGSCTAKSCRGHEVDIMHFSIGTAIPGGLYGGNPIENNFSMGSDRFDHLVDAYAWNPHCKYLDGNDSDAWNDWQGTWWHSSLGIRSGLIEEDSPYSTDGQKGTYYFEFSRPLRTADKLQQDVQFTIGKAGRFSVAFWYPVNGVEKQPGVLQRVGSAAASLVLFPYYTFNYLVSSSDEALRNPLVDKSLLILLLLVHYRKCVSTYPMGNNMIENGDSDLCLKENLQFSYNPYRKAFENARDVDFDRLDVERNGHSGSLVRLPYASLFDNLGLSLGDETSILLLYSLVHGNSDFLEYVLVRTDIDTFLMPILETLYNASKRKPNQIYMLLIILLILSQDSSFNASIHNLVVPSIPWYQERLLTNTSLGSLMVIILIRTVKYNLSKLRDVYLHTNCLATLANMAPHVHRLSAYASQRLISLFDMISRKYTKLVEHQNDKVGNCKDDQPEECDKMVEDTSTELHLYTDFLRIVLETINLILTYALPRNPEVVYAIMHRQEVFQPFKSHPRFNELLENIYTVLDFFNSRMDTQQIDGGWSVDKVLEVIIINCRSWHGEGMKMFTQLRFTYEEENHSEEFFIPYIWQLVMSQSGFTFDAGAIDLFAVEMHVDESTSFSDDAIV